jgi:hypothetical protein
VGSHRDQRPLSPIEVARALKSAQDAGASPKDIAAELHFNGPTMVGRFVRLLQLDDAVHHMVSWGNTGATVSFTTASELTRLKSADEQLSAWKAVLENQLTSAEVKELIQLKQRGAPNIEAAVASLLERRPQVERLHVLLGSVVAPEMREQLARNDQAKRNAILKEALATRFPTLERYDGSLGTSRFTIAGGEEVERCLLKETDNFEAEVNEALALILRRENEHSN